LLNEERKRQEGNFETHEEIEKISVFLMSGVKEKQLTGFLRCDKTTGSPFRGTKLLRNFTSR